MTKISPVEEIFFAALEKTTPALQAAYLDVACAGQSDLRARVEKLLAAHPRVGGFLEPEAVIANTGVFDAGKPDSSDQPSAIEGTVVAGKYKLLQQIGEGGMGSVWMADQTEPVKRRVAVKLIRIERGSSKMILSRFEAERQAIALMDHPHIAKLLEAGTTDAGQPYFVMELVKGIPLTEYCDAHKLSIPERLALFQQICSAVQHAHQKGIIHRDLKPTNILVESHDGKPVPKVIDFGLAKATSGMQLTDRTLFTAFGNVMGTPAYMAPEQATFNAVDVDTRADVYSLGVILYELLTGTTPITRETVKKAALDVILKLVREQDAPRPSSRLSTAETMPAIAANRNIDPAKLSKLLRGDLDWVVLKALEKDRTRRYETANGLAADIRRHLSNEPVVARPPSAAYRLQKAWLRNKLAFTAAAAVAVALIAGIATSTWQAVRAQRAKTQAVAAQAEAVAALAKAEAAQKVAETEQQRADAQADIATQEVERSRRLLYASDLNVAHQFWEVGNLARARELLERQRPQGDQVDLRGFEWRYLWRLCQDGSLHTFRGHTHEVNAVAFSPEGTLLASASQDGNVRLWDVASRREAGVLPGSQAVTSLAFSPDGKTLATASHDRFIRLWDLAAKREVGRLPGVWGAVIAFSPDGTLLASTRGGQDRKEIKLWNVTTLQEVGALLGHTELTTRVVFSPDGKTLASGSADTTVRLWDVDTHREIAKHTGHNAWISGLEFSPDGKTLASAADDGNIKLWETATQQEIANLRGNATSFPALTFSNDSKLLVTGSGDTRVKFWDVATKEEVATLRGHTATVTAVAFAPDGQTLATASTDQTVKLWQIATRQDPNTLTGHKGWVNSVAFAQGGKILAVGDDHDQTVKLWDLATRQQVAVLKGHKGVVWSVAIAPGGKTLASTSSDKTVRLWDLATRQQVAEFEHQTVVGSATFSPDGKLLAASDWGPNVLVWDIAANQKLAQLRGGRPRFTPDGKKLAIIYPGGTAIQLWDVANWQPEATKFTGHTAQIDCLEFSPDGTLLATCSRDSTVRLWQVATAKEVTHLKGHTGRVDSVAFLPDGKTLATCGMEGVIKLWNLTIQQEVATLRGHRGPVASVAFSPDGNLLASSGADGTVRLWPAAPFQETDVPVDLRPAASGAGAPGR